MTCMARREKRKKKTEEEKRVIDIPGSSAAGREGKEKENATFYPSEEGGKFEGGKEKEVEGRTRYYLAR